MSVVKLYVYDLSNGLAKSMSLQMIGKQIDGIWHSSIVVFGMEIFYGGQGIEITSPGRSHHGRPLRIENMGETAIDRETFEEYINQMRDHYLGDKVKFNCNSFTNDCVGFLTGRAIPDYIKDLPSDFLSTPFGAALRPTIDSMFRSPGTSTPPSAQPLASTPNALPQSAAARASGTQPTASKPAVGASVLAAPLQIATNPSALKSILSRHKAVAVFFTSATCPPCRTIEPVFEHLAYSKASVGVAFVKIDLGVGMSSTVASEYSVRATPTFILFNDGIKSGEVKGANATELRSAVDLMIFQAYPPHPHTTLNLPAVRAISLQPILYKQKPNIKAAYSKLESFINSSKDASNSKSHHAVAGSLVPWLDTYNNSFSNPPDSGDLEKWRAASLALTNSLELDKLFPLLDFWRLLLLEVRLGSLLAQNLEPINTFLVKTKASLESSANATANPRNSYITLLRLLSNAFANSEVASQLLGPQVRQKVVSVIVPCLLHSDSAVRSAAAGVAFNSAAYYQANRVKYYRDGKRGDPVPESMGSEEWELEMIPALLENLSQEVQSEDVAHRASATLALVIYLSPRYEEVVKPLLEVLQAKEMLQSKLDPQLFGGKGISKKEVKELIHEVSAKLCP